MASFPEPLAGSGTEEIVPRLAAQGLAKSFGPVRAMSDVNLVVRPGEIHGLVGHNGSGKSTFVRTLSAFHERDSGALALNGHELPRSFSAQDVRRLGVGFVHQNLGLIPDMSVMDNMGFSARGFEHGSLGTIDWGKQSATVSHAIGRLGLRVSPRTPVSRLSPAEQTLLAMARALGEFEHEVLLVLDEPTARLSKEGVDLVHSAMRELAGAGAGILYISHRLSDVLDMCENFTVFRDGCTVACERSSDHDHDSLVRLMTGAETSRLHQTPRQRGSRADAALLDVRGAYATGLEDVTFDVARGEVVCITGAVGSGAAEVGRMVYGLTPLHGGELSVDGQGVGQDFDPFAARALGVAYISSDRQGEAGLLTMSVAENVHAAGDGALPSLGWQRPAVVAAEARTVIQTFNVRPGSAESEFSRLSGGNQQRVLLGKWLRLKPSLLVVDEPTQGIDAASREEIYTLVDSFVEQGLSVLWITTDLEEVLRVADRVYVLHGGSVAFQGDGTTLDMHTLTKAVLGGATSHG